MRRLLIANRGEIARRIIRTARAMGIGTVAVFSDPDRYAPFVAEADRAVRLPGSTPAETYLDIEGIVAAARRADADAVHPGYGFLSENAEFARRCEDAGLTFVGPSADVIEKMGSKLTAKALMEAAGVPVLPGAEVTSAQDAVVAAERIGWPVLVKAAFGGGGRGMRVAHDAGELGDAIESARREAASAFGNATLFIERFVQSPRHIEVQIFGDRHGTVIHLFERECSIQRRYQKIVEESPSPAVDEHQRAALGQAAVAAATVEFVMDGSGQFFFLEVNTRLQVEHPVTEEVTGLDLVALQLEVARGEPLPPAALAAEIRGHAIEARLYAEDVNAGFLPTAGHVERFQVPAGPGIRVDSGVVDGSVVSPYYDAMLAKVIAWGPTRADAAGRLADTLHRSQVHGIVTNRDLLVGILRHPEFLTGQTDTGFLERHPPAELSRPDPSSRTLHAIAASLDAARRRRGGGPLPAGIPSGWRNVGPTWQRAEWEDSGGPIVVRYRLERDGVAIEVDGEPIADVVVGDSPPGIVDLSIDGVRGNVTVAPVGPISYVDSILGSSAFGEVPRFPLPRAAALEGSLLAPMPGNVVRVQTAPGRSVRAGEPLLVLEAMKMEHVIRAPRDGTVTEVRVAAGQQVDAGVVLAVVEDAASNG
jgi:acyl-CoA carboxylase subunit alpha